MNKRKNILWICTDSQRWDTLGCYGNKWVNTPNIDRLAAEGILFENTFCQNPLCTPSRGSFLTGRYPVTNKLRQNGQDISADEIPITKILHDNGYVCGLSGKLHISACDHRIKLHGKTDWWKGDSDLFFVGSEPRIDDGYDEFYWDHDPGHPSSSSAYKRWLLEKGVSYNTKTHPECEFVLEGMPSEYHQTTFCIEKAMGFIEGYQNAKSPWLFSVNMFDPHFQIDPPKEFLDRYMEIIDEIPDIDYREGESDNRPPYHKIYQENMKMNVNTLSARQRKLIKAAYWAMVDHIDFQIGRLLDTLEKTGQKENTMVIFTSDHGELLGDHGLFIKGPFLYDSSIRVPLIISLPGTIPTGTRTDELTELCSLAPTILEYADLPVHPGMQAKSIWPKLTGKKDDTPINESVYCEYYNSNPDKPSQFCTMVRTRKYKLIAFHGQEPGELYDLEKDPKEFNNLWEDAAYLPIKSDMLKLLCDRMAQTADPLPERIGIY